MPALCKCENGHLFNSLIIEDSPEINALLVKDECCPECNTTEFEILEIFDDSEEI